MSVDASRYAPDFLIKINGQERFRLGTNIDVTSVVIKESMNRSDTFTLTVRDRHATLERFPNGNELRWFDSTDFDEGNLIEIEMGYINNRSLIFVGKITSIAIDFAASGIITLTVTGQSLYTQLHRAHLYKPFASKRDTDIVRAIASQIGLGVEVDETNTEHKTVSYDGTTLAGILQERAERLNFEVGVKKRTLYFKKPSYLVNTNSTLTLKWGESLISFKPQLNSHNMPSEIRQRSPQTSLGGDDEPIVSQIKASEYSPRLGAESGVKRVAAKFGDNIQTIADHRAESAEESKAMVTAEMQRKALDFVTGSGTTIGNPQLVSRTVIELQGLGKKFSGKYYVTETTHTISASGYQTTFEAKRDGI